MRGPTREQWAGQQKAPRDEREESAGGAGGYGNSQNPAWAGQSANLESDVAGRGSYGAKGTEGTSGYGRYSDDGGEGRMVASPNQRQTQNRGSLEPENYKTPVDPSSWFSSSWHTGSAAKAARNLSPFGGRSGKLTHTCL